MLYSDERFWCVTNEKEVLFTQGWWGSGQEVVDTLVYLGRIGRSEEWRAIKLTQEEYELGFMHSCSLSNAGNELYK